MAATYENPETMPLLSSEMTEGIVDAMPIAKAWARRQLRSALAAQPSVGTIISGLAAVQVLREIRDHLIARSIPIVNAYSPTRWLWYLRRTDFAIIRGYLTNTESSIVRIAENLSGLSELPADRDLSAIEVPLVFALDNSAFARLARLLAIAELVNHGEGWLRRSSKNTEFLMKADGFPDLVQNDELETAIDEFDERVVTAASYRWHPSLSDVGSTASGLPLLTVAMLKDGVGQTPMWKGRFADKPQLFEGEGRFVVQAYSLSDQSNAEQLRGSLLAMESPEIAAAFRAL